jgi:hypothetical protein
MGEAQVLVQIRSCTMQLLVNNESGRQSEVCNSQQQLLLLQEAYAVEPYRLRP